MARGETYYTNDINYIISSYIREYDMSKANINVLYTKGAITKEMYDHLYSADRNTREVTIGLMQKKDKRYVNILKEGIKEYRNKFIIANSIEECDILSVKNDALFIINKVPTVTKFDDLIEFKLKNVYTSFYKLKNLELYYSFNPIGNIEKLDIKGINQSKLSLHKDYFMEFLLVLFCSAQTEPIEDTIDLLTGFYNKYLNLELDIEYYREFNSESKYLIQPTKLSNACYMLDNINNTLSNKKSLNTTYNLNILRDLSQYFSNVLVQKMRQ